MSNPRYPTRTKTILDDSKFKLSADPLPNGKGRPSLCLYCANTPNQEGGIAANPRIDVYTNVPNDKQNGLIRAAMDSEALFNLFECLKLIQDPATESPSAFAIDNGKPDFRNGKRQEEPLIETKTMVGKDKEGRCYISILSTDSDRPKIRFYFAPGIYHRITRIQGGQPLTSAELSAICVRGWISKMQQFFPIVASEAYNYAPRPDNNSGNNSGNRGGYGNNSNNKSSSESMEDDLPF